jgi:hypothetical protein
MLIHYKTAIQNRTVLKLIIGVTPVFELLHFIRYQHFDSFPQLFFKESGVKTHTCEYLFDIIEHLHFKNLVLNYNRLPQSNDESKKTV